MIARVAGAPGRTALWLSLIAIAAGLLLPHVVFIGLATDLIVAGPNGIVHRGSTS